jgi:hypothetical protein
MGKEEIREAILELMEQIPENALLGVLEYLRELAKVSEMDPVLGDNLSKIMFEDDDLLQQLAQ